MFLPKLFHTGGEDADSSLPSPPANHPPIDYTKWSPAGPNDVRSPCPAINALANHHILPHDGKNIDKSTITHALTEGLNIAPSIASVFVTAAMYANPERHAKTFDLDHVSKHGYIEHDGSLSRGDAAFGEATEFSQEAFDEVLAKFREAHPGKGDDEIETDWQTAARARWARVMKSKDRCDGAGKDWLFGLREAIMSFGETSLYLNLLGKDGVAPLRWVRIFFEEERLPYAEGWRPPKKFDQADLNHGYAEMIKSYGHGEEEARLVGAETFDWFTSSIMKVVQSAVPKFG